MRPPPPPQWSRPSQGSDHLADALDANRDGIIDSEELSNAPALLRKLDRDGDGKLSREEATGRKGGKR